MKFVKNILIVFIFLSPYFGLTQERQTRIGINTYSNISYFETGYFSFVNPNLNPINIGCNFEILRKQHSFLIGVENLVLSHKFDLVEWNSPEIIGYKQIDYSIIKSRNLVFPLLYKTKLLKSNFTLKGGLILGINYFNKEEFYFTDQSKDQSKSFSFSIFQMIKIGAGYNIDLSKKINMDISFNLSQQFKKGNGFGAPRLYNFISSEITLFYDLSNSKTKN